MPLTTTERRYVTQYWLEERVALDRVNNFVKAMAPQREEVIRQLCERYSFDGLFDFGGREAKNAPKRFRCSVPAWLLDGYYAAAKEAWQAPILEQYGDLFALLD